jgi:pyruvate/2-oxoacid:ferredoxin oxidoreductase beta subunit
MAWVWCEGCGELLPQKLIKRARHDRSFGVCPGCVKAWETEGRTCAVCDTSIAEGHTLAFSRERQGLSHGECGGVVLL